MNVIFNNKIIQLIVIYIYSLIKRTLHFIVFFNSDNV